MDGNGRWVRNAVCRARPVAVGAETFRTIATYRKDIGVQYSVYAFYRKLEASAG
ncbi:MAG: hypothetical protein ACLUDF_06905 [Butyricicoccus sp.]